MSQQLVLLLDTNAWLDYYLPWRSGYAAAQRLIVGTFEQNQTLAYAVPSIKDVFYMAAAEHKRAERAVLARASGAGGERAGRRPSGGRGGCVCSVCCVGHGNDALRFRVRCVVRGVLHQLWQMVDGTPWAAPVGR